MFTVDIKFHYINEKNEKTLLFNKIPPPPSPRPNISKNKKKNQFERSTLQIMRVIIMNEEKDIINTFTYTCKTHSTLKEKEILFLCVLRILIF